MQQTQNRNIFELVCRVYCVEVTYLKAMTAHDLSDMEIIKRDIKRGLILIIRVGPMALKDVQELRHLIKELYDVAKAEGSDIARLGEERMVITPPHVQIWRPQYDLK